jgi:hypothetical protein
VSVEWVIWYDNGTSFSSEDGPPDAAPRVGVQVVAVRDIRVGRLLWAGDDYYCWQEGQWVPHTQDGLVHYLDTVYPALRLRGYAVSDERFQRVYGQALADPRLPPKSASDVREKAILR